MTRTEAHEDKSFLADVIGKYFLEDVIKWISVNLSPEQVFEEDNLRMWAISNDFIEDKA